MRFAAKYETLQKVAIGRVETFIARDRASNQKVVVHTFECPEQAIGQSIMQCNLTAFSALAPGAVAPVIDAGRFDGTTFGYLVTEWPGDESLQEWVRSYQGEPRGARISNLWDNSTAILGSGQTIPPSAPKPNPSGNQEIGAAVDPASSPTLMFPAASGRPAPLKEANQSDKDSIASGGVSRFFQQHEHTVPTRGGDASPNAPGEFTNQFFLGSQADLVNPGKPTVEDTNALAGNRERAVVPGGETLFNAEPTVRQSSPASSTSSTEKPSEALPKVSGPLLDAVEAGQFTNLFFKPIEPKEPISPPRAAQRDSGETAEAGEFTNFFKGPFSGEKPAEVPKISLEATPREKTPGDFTRVFGSSEQLGSAEPQMAPIPSTPTVPGAPQGAFTELFEAPKPAVRDVPIESPWSPRQPAEAASHEVPVDRDRQMPSASPFPSGSPEPFAEPKSFSGSSVRDVEHLSSLPDAGGNATRVFSRPSGVPSMDQPSVPTGPSAWTVFQRSEKAAPIAPEEPPVQPASRGGFRPEVPSSAAPVIPSAQVPAVPYVAPPQVPQPAMPTPAMPSAQVPAVPYVAPPQVPYSVPQPALPAPPAVAVQPPQPPPAPKEKVSYWPLIIVLNVLFIIAVLLILYFALKH